MKHSSTSPVARTLVTWEQRSLTALARLTTVYPKTVLLVCLAVAALASLYTVRHLGFVAGRNDLISSDKPYVRLDEEYTKEFVGVAQVVVVVEPRDIQQGKEFVTRLATILQQDNEHVADVFSRIDTSSLEGKKLLYLSVADLQALRDHLTDDRDLIRVLTTAPGLHTLLHAINQQVSVGMVSHLVSDFLGLGSPDKEPAGEKKPVEIGFFRVLLQEMERALSRTDHQYRSPWAEFFGGTEELSDDGFLVADNHHFVFLMVEPKASPDQGFSEYAGALAAIRGAIARLLPDFPGLAAGVTGTRALNNDETISTQADAQVATVASLLGVALLYVLFFRKLRHPVLIMTTLMLGLAWTMGFVALTVGHLTIITVFVAPMLLGLADDFGVHFISRYEEERSQGQNATTALHTVFAQTVPGITAGALTTALAFYAVMLADFRGMQELGWITGSGILLSLVAMLTFLPALVAVLESYSAWEAGSQRGSFLSGAFAGWGRFIERARWPVFIVTGLATLGGLAALPTLSFDYNLLRLQAHGTESVEWELRLLANSERSSWNALATASTPEEATRKTAAFKALPAVETVESVASLIPGNQQERFPLVRSLQPLFVALPPLSAVPTSVDVPELQQTLDKLRLKIREENADWNLKQKPPEQELSAVRRSLLAVIESLRSLPEEEAKVRLVRFQTALFTDFHDKWSLLRNNLDPSGPITLADIPAQLKNRFVNQDGTKFLLQIYPKENIWERGPQERFVSQLRQVDPDVTGSPIIGHESIRAMKEGYIEGGMYAFIAIVVVTFLALRRFGDTLLAMIPLVQGMLWTVGLMWLWDVQFNLANLVAAPLIIGIGVENGIHLVHRFREDERTTPAALVGGSTGQSIALFSLTTMVGFGSLMVAKYYGIFSMGLLLTVAVGSVLLSSLAVLPLLLSRPTLTQSDEASTGEQEAHKRRADYGNEEEDMDTTGDVALSEHGGGIGEVSGRTRAESR